MWLCGKVGNSIAESLGPIRRRVMVFVYAASDESMFWLISAPKLEKAVADIQSASSSQRIVVWPYSKGCSLLESCTLTVPQQHG